MVVIKKLNKNVIILSVLLLLFIFFSIKSYADSVISDLSSNILRFHVIANSDSEDDQKLKYQVRDSLINYMNSINSNSNSKDNTILTVQEHIDDFKNIAQQIVKDSGFNYCVDVELGNCFFPTKKYGDVSFPVGYYDALRVKIGNCEGRNWWCVMFPPLCFIDSNSASISEDSKLLLENSLSNEDYELICKSNEQSEIKFKIVEAFNNFASKFCNNY
ncbi:MAG: stage II sporulation protein R [Clostridia bacterium]|nr:stage II sporulation protein R [Clostridia bacterium]